MSSITLYPAVDNDDNTTVWSPDADIGQIVAILNTALDMETAAHLAVLMAAGANLIQRLSAELDMEIDALVQMLMSPDGVSGLAQALQERGLTMPPAAGGERTIEVDEDDVYRREDGTLRVTIMTRGRHGLHLVDADGADRLRREMYACAHELTRILADQGYFDDEGGQ